MCYCSVFQASRNSNLVIGNDPTDKGAENLIIVDVDVDVNTNATMNNKIKRKNTSKVWLDFDANGNDKALCNHRKRSFVADVTSGTSHFAQHNKRCIVKFYKEKKSIMSMKKSDGST